MALSNNMVFELRSSATTGNFNGAGFATNSTNFLTDWTVDAGTGNTASPVISSASYSFVSADVNGYFYCKSGTNWYSGTWWLISSVSGGKATLNAAAGAGRTQSTLNPSLFTATTVAGVASVGTPTSGTCGVDFSQQDTAACTATDIVTTMGVASITSISAPWRKSMLGNCLRVVNGWYEMVGFTTTSSITLDRTQGNNLTAQTMYLGGAGRLNGLEDAFFESLPLGGLCWLKSGSNTVSAAISISTSNGTSTTPNWLIGYTTNRGDACTGSNRPLIVMGSNGCTFPPEHHLVNVRFTTTNAAGIIVGANSRVDNCSAINTSSTAAGKAWNISTANSIVFTGCEGVSLNGVAFSSTSGILRMFGCYAHDSTQGLQSSASQVTIVNCVFESCRTSCCDLTGSSASGYSIYGCTFYGRESKIGTGILSVATTTYINYVCNSIFYGLTTGINHNTAQGIDFLQGNCFYNNTTDVTGISKGADSLAVDPGFAAASQLTGTTAATSGSVLTQSGGNFANVTDNVDYLTVISGTGVTVATYLITGHTTTTLTLNNAIGTSAGGDVVYYVGVDHNFGIGTNLRAASALNWSGSGLEFQSYMDIGAVQRQEATASGGGGAMVRRIP